MTQICHHSIKNYYICITYSNVNVSSIISNMEWYKITITHPQKLRIIITEENADIQTVLAGTFALKGHQVFKTFNADECLKMIAELNNQVDVVVMNGKTASDRGAMLIIKIKRMNSDIKIFAIADDENDKTRILEYGAEEFAIKPISAETIVDKLNNIFLKERQLAK